MAMRGILNYVYAEFQKIEIETRQKYIKGTQLQRA